MRRKSMALGLLALIGFMALMVVLTVVYSTTETLLGAPVARLTTIFIVLALSTFVYFVTEFEIKGAKKLACGLVPWIIGLTLVNTLIPNTKQAAAMIVLPAIVNSEAVQQLPGELTTLAREWLQELRPAKKRGAK